MFSPSSVSVLLVFNIIHTIVFATPASLTSDCKPCHSEIVCPQSDADCESGTRVSDPCACCIDGICPQLETEHCSFDKPCERGYACVKANGDEETSCRCRRDKRAVCGSDNTTYISICSLQRQPHKPSLLKWGHCDKAPEIVSASGDIVVLEGQPMALDCEVKGNPIPSINWYFTSLDGATKLLPSDDQVTAVLVRGGPENMMVTSWMQIVEARRSDQGTYSCIATNDHGIAKHNARVNMIIK